MLSDGSLAGSAGGRGSSFARPGERRPISGSVAPIRDHKGAVAGAVLVFGRAANLKSPPFRGCCWRSGQQTTESNWAASR